MQRTQNKVSRYIINNNYPYTSKSNEIIRRDFHIKSTDDLIKNNAKRYEEIFHNHPMILELFDTELDIRRLKRTKPYKLVV